MIIRWLLVAYLLVLAFFGWGYASGRYQVFPNAWLEPFLNEVVAYWEGTSRDSVSELVTLDHQERPSDVAGNGFVLLDPDFKDDGFLLISRYSKSHKQTVVELFDIANQQVVHTWVPNLDEVFKAAPGFTTGINTKSAYRSQNPLLMANGDIVTGSGEGPLVRLDVCGKPVWAIDRHFHHSLEQDANGNIIAASVTPRTELLPGIKVRDDGIAIISPEGRVIKEYSISQIFLDNGLDALLFGVGAFEEDRFHLNDVQPLRGKSAESGLLLSIRNLSTVALFKPETGKIEWWKTGPWLNQHDASDLGNGWVGIFGNQFIRGPEKFHKDERSEIFLYEPKTGRTRTPFRQVFADEKIRTGYEGRAQILDNGDAFVEETLRFRLLRMSEQKPRWVYVNNVTEKTGGALHWSRYLAKGAISPATMQRLGEIKCN